MLALLAETFALWSQNLQVANFQQACSKDNPLSDVILAANMFKTPTQFCHETTKFVEICLQHMPMDLIPDLDDVTILLSNLQKNLSVRAGYLSIIVWHSNCLQLEQRVVKINASYRQRICDDALMNMGC